METQQNWHVYILRCADGTLYTGITTDLERRLKEHNSSDRGARYTRSRRPVRLAWSEEAASHAAASRREHDIRKMGRHGKLALLAGRGGEPPRTGLWPDVNPIRARFRQAPVDIPGTSER